MVSAPEKTQANNGSHFGRAATKIQVKTVLTAAGDYPSPAAFSKIVMIKKSIKFFFSAVALLMTAMNAFAQGNGAAGITEATQMVTSYFDPATKLIYAIGAVVGLIGGVKVYSKFSSGDPDTGKTAASWFGACIFLIVAATILRSFFL
jgi:hypothetical protein